MQRFIPYALLVVGVALILGCTSLSNARTNTALEQSNTTTFTWSTRTPVPTRTPLPTRTPIPTRTPTATATPGINLVPLHTSGTTFQDANGQTIVLKGFVTLANVTYTDLDYQRMSNLGANYQSIRITLSTLGFGKGDQPGAYLLGSLDSMVSLAAHYGMRTDFKLAVYDVPAFNGSSTEDGWTALWNNQPLSGSLLGSQDELIWDWQVLWAHYATNTSVIGYDLLNEPQKGSLALSDDQFVATKVNPFYQKAIGALRATDPTKIAFYQTPLGGSLGYLPYPVAIGPNQNVGYVGHFYPDLPQYLAGNLTTNAYAPTMTQYLAAAAASGVPLMIGEYGNSWNPADDGNATKEAQFTLLEQTALALFHQNGLSYSRPWYANDSAATAMLANGRLTPVDWALIRGTTDLNGPLRTFITTTFP